VKRHRPGKTFFLALSGAFLLWCLVGCATCSPKCCETCPPEIRTVTIRPPPVLVPPPLLPVPDAPEITSAVPPEVAAADPEGWLESLLTDLESAINAYLEARGIIETSNATRPPN
jgi:hypothetical protein